MSIDWGADFRDTSGFPNAADPANCFFARTEEYPHDYSGLGGPSSAGWDFVAKGTTAFSANEDATIDTRLAGAVGNVNSPTVKQTFRVDLPSTGTYTIALAVGDASYERTNQTWDLQDNGVSFSSLTGGDTLGTHEYFDASQVVRTSAVDWVNNNATITHTFTDIGNGTAIFQLVIGDGVNFTLINHVRITGPAVVASTLFAQSMF